MAYPQVFFGGKDFGTLYSVKREFPLLEITKTFVKDFGDERKKSFFAEQTTSPAVGRTAEG
jgi:hypothetical protein